MARRALRFWSATGTARIYTRRKFINVSVVAILFVYRGWVPQIRKDDCVFCHFHTVICRDWLRTGGPDILSTHLCTFCTLRHQHGSMSWKKKRTLIFVGEEFVARKTIPTERGRRICDSVRVFLVAQGWPHLSFLLSFGYSSVRPFFNYVNKSQMKMESEMYLRNNETLSLSLLSFSFTVRLGRDSMCAQEIRNGTEIGHTFGLVFWRNEFFCSRRLRNSVTFYFPTGSE